MNIAYIDMNFDDTIEDYHYSPKRYGGGRIIASALLYKLDTFDIYSNSESFVNIEKSKQNQCFSLDNAARQKIKNGDNIKKYIPNCDKYDIFLHHFSNVFLNLEGCRSQKQAVWSVGWREQINPNNKNILLFDHIGQEPQMVGNHKIFKIVIGPKFEQFKKYDKEDIIFQCSRHFPLYQSIAVAQLALKYNIKTYFAGPIENGYPLIDFIDNKNTFYLGVIDSETKQDFYKRAKLNTQFQNYPISATLAGKEAASYGCGILACPVGGWNLFIKEGLNGFFINNEIDFINAWEKRGELKQQNCYNLGLPHSEENMINSVLNALKAI